MRRGFFVFFHKEIIHFFRAVYNVQKRCIIATMNLNEINEQMDKAAARRKSFETNRSLCALVAVFIGYSFYKGIDEGAATWFYIVMPLLIALAVFLVVFDTKRINQAKAELEELRAAKEAVESDLAAQDDDADDGDDTGKIADDASDEPAADSEVADSELATKPADSDEKPSEIHE